MSDESKKAIEQMAKTFICKTCNGSGKKIRTVVNNALTDNRDLTIFSNTEPCPDCREKIQFDGNIEALLKTVTSQAAEIAELKDQATALADQNKLVIDESRKRGECVDIANKQIADLKTENERLQKSNKELYRHIKGEPTREDEI